MFCNLFPRANPQNNFSASRGTPIYENIYRSEEVASGERSSIAAKLVYTKVISEEMLYVILHCKNNTEAFF